MGDGIVGSDVPRVRAYLGTEAAEFLTALDSLETSVVVEELKGLSLLEEVAQGRSVIPGLAEGYLALVLPSGYMVVYRHLSAQESRKASSGFSESSAYLIAQISFLVGVEHADGCRHYGMQRRLVTGLFGFSKRVFASVGDLGV